MNKNNFEDLIEKYKDCSTDKQEFEINGTKYIVTSHYYGNKDIDKVLYNLAKNQAYRDIQNIYYQNIDFGGMLWYT